MMLYISSIFALFMSTVYAHAGHEAEVINANYEDNFQLSWIIFIIFLNLALIFYWKVVHPQLKLAQSNAQIPASSKNDENEVTEKKAVDQDEESDENAPVQINLHADPHAKEDAPAPAASSVEQVELTEIKE